MNKIKFILILISFFSYSVYPQSNEKNILVLHSYHKGLSWTEKVINGIESVFNNKILTSYNIKIFYEYMDTKRFEEPDYIQLLIPLYKYKSQKIHYDLIIAVDDNALNFLLNYRNEIFGEIPVVFCGINFYDKQKIHQIKKITGVVEAFSAKENIELILKLHPKTNHIVVVGDNTLTSQLNNKVLKNIEKDFPQLKFEYLTSANLYRYRRYLNTLKDGSVVLAMLFNLDNKNKFYTYEESFKYYSVGVNVPIYTYWDFYIGIGAIGGKIISGFYQGETAARLALEILDGKDPDQILIITESPNKYIFDYNELSKFSINPDLLPEKSIIINKPIDIKELYKKYYIYVNIIILIFIFLIFIIITLLININKRKAIERELKATNEAYYKFVPKEFLSYLGKETITEISLGDAIEREFAILFSDIRNFTTISEKMSPKENFQFVNDYLHFMGPAIRMYNGFIDKFIGDAIMALFPNSNDAIKASLEMINRLYEFNSKSKTKYNTTINIGIGIHTGKLMLGTVGETHRMDSTVISDVVNISSRLESLTKNYGSKIICTQEIVDSLNEKSKFYAFRYLGRVIVKGKSRPVTIYEIIDAEELPLKEIKIQNRSLLEEAIQCYEKNQIQESIQILTKLSHDYLQDKAVHYILHNILKEVSR